MTSISHRVGVWTLASEDIRALPRNGFALASFGFVLALFVPLVAFAFSGPRALDDSLVITWLVGGLVVAIIVASRVAAARRSRFVDSLYTTPLDQRTWLAAQAIVGGFLALLVIAVQVPFLLVHIAFVGIPAALPALVAAALCIAAFAVALGLFCGVVVGDAGAGAASGLAGGISFLSFVLVLLHGILVSGPPSATQGAMLRLCALSPLTLVIEGFGIDIFNGAPADPLGPLVGLAAMIAALAGAAWWSYTRSQGPLGWEARGGRWVVVGLVALAVAIPVASAEVTYTDVADSDAAIYSPGEHTQVAFVARGAPLQERAFTLSEVYKAPDLQRGRDVELDALVLLDVPEGARVRSVSIAIQGSETVRVVSGGVFRAPDGEPSGRAPAGEGWDSLSAAPPKAVYRVPVTLRVVSVEALRDSPSLVEVRTDFVADGAPMRSIARLELHGEIPGAATLVTLAGAPLPLAALSAFITRKLRTR